MILVWLQVEIVNKLFAIGLILKREVDKRLDLSPPVADAPRRADRREICASAGRAARSPRKVTRKVRRPEEAATRLARQGQENEKA